MKKITLQLFRRPNSKVEQELVKVAIFHSDGSLDVNSPKVGVDDAESLRLSVLDLLPDEIMESVKIDFNAIDGTVRFTHRSDIPLGQLRIVDIENKRAFAIPSEVVRDPITDRAKTGGLCWVRHSSLDNWELLSTKLYPHEKLGSAARFYGTIWRNFKPDGPFNASFIQRKSKTQNRPTTKPLKSQEDLEKAMELIENSIDLECFFH